MSPAKFNIYLLTRNQDLLRYYGVPIKFETTEEVIEEIFLAMLSLVLK